MRKGRDGVFAERYKLREGLYVVLLIKGSDGERTNFRILVFQERKKLFHLIVAAQQLTHKFIVALEIFLRLESIWQAVVEDVAGGEEFESGGGLFKSLRWRGPRRGWGAQEY